MDVTVKIFNAAGEEVRQCTVTVEPGKGWKKRAEEEAMKFISEGERIQVVPPEQQDGQNAKAGQFKFTFEFEIYYKGVLKRTTEVSALADSEATALEQAVHALQAELETDEILRYTNRFRRHAA